MKQQIEQLNGETWKDIPGYEGLYQASSFGRIKSFRRYPQGKIKSSYIGWGSYQCVQLHVEKVYKTFTVHKLVALAFLPEIKDKPHINHIDGNKQNNSPSNLEWCTRSENMQHALKMGWKPRVHLTKSL